MTLKSLIGMVLLWIVATIAFSVCNWDWHSNGCTHGNCPSGCSPVMEFGGTVSTSCQQQGGLCCLCSVQTQRCKNGSSYCADRLYRTQIDIEGECSLGQLCNQI